MAVLLGSEIRIGDDRYRVIGTFTLKGSSLGGNSDNFVVIPLSTFLNTYGKLQSIHIMIKAKNTEVYDDCVEEARMVLRTIRNVAPGDEDDFTIFSNDSLISTFNDFTLYVKLGVGFMSFICIDCCRYRYYEYHACLCHGTNKRNRYSESARCPQVKYSCTVYH